MKRDPLLVKEWALKQLHWMIQKDPWVQEIMVAAGLSLDELADRIVAIYNFEDFTKLNLDQVRYYEWLLDIDSDESKTLEERRAAIQAAWNAGQKPSLEMLRALCEAWRPGFTSVTYVPAELTIRFGKPGRPDKLKDLQTAIDRVIPAHIFVHYAYFILIKDVHEVMTLEEMESYHMYDFDFSTGGDE